MGEITGLYMNDDEGEIVTVDVQAKFVNGKPEAIEAKHVMRSPIEWDRFMRFMERYAQENELGFSGVRAPPARLRVSLAVGPACLMLAAPGARACLWRETTRVWHGTWVVHALAGLAHSVGRVQGE
jgi:Psb28 protein